MNTVKIPFTPTKLSAQTPLKDNGCFIELCPGYLRYFADFIAEEPNNPEDHMLGWKESRTYFDTIIRREHISSIELSLGSFERVVVFFSTAAENFSIYFTNEDFDKAKSMFDQMQVWFVNDEICLIPNGDYDPSSWLTDLKAFQRSGRVFTQSDEPTE